jgi:hypothetical protein
VQACEQGSQNERYRASFITAASPTSHPGGIMNTYEAYVRVMPSNMVVKTHVCADSTQSALFLLQGMYGSDNVVHLPMIIS